MSFYRVPGPPRHEFPKLYLSVAALVAAAIMASGMPAFGMVSIQVNGEPTSVTRGSTVAALASEGVIDTSRGDVVSLAGDVVVYGGGGESSVRRGLESLDRDTLVYEHDRIESRAGQDVIEGTVTTTTAIPIPVTYEGDGPLLSLEVPGAPGIRETTVGEYSGRIADSRVLVAADPMVYRRYAPPHSGRVVALTFDDGPWPGQTERVLEILAKEEVKATFFMLGVQVQAHPELARRVANEGHQIGNHTLGHLMLPRVSPSVVHAQIGRGQEAIEKATGVVPTWFRPPGGLMSRVVTDECKDYGLEVALWTVDPQDWRPSEAEQMTQDVVGFSEPGGVILLHDGGGNRSVTIEALGPIIRELKKRGFGFVTMDEL